MLLARLSLSFFLPPPPPSLSLFSFYLSPLFVSVYLSVYLSVSPSLALSILASSNGSAVVLRSSVLLINDYIIFTQNKALTGGALKILDKSQVLYDNHQCPLTF